MLCAMKRRINVRLYRQIIVEVERAMRTERHQKDRFRQSVRQEAYTQEVRLLYREVDILGRVYNKSV